MNSRTATNGVVLRILPARLIGLLVTLVPGLTGCAGEEGLVNLTEENQWEIHFQSDGPGPGDHQRISRSTAWQPLDPTSTYHTPEGTRFIWLRTRLPATIDGYDHVMVRRCLGIFEYYQGDQLIGRAGRWDPTAPLKRTMDSLDFSHVLAGNYGGQMLTVRLVALDSSLANECRWIAIGKEKSFLRLAVGYNIGFFVVGIICLVLGLQGLIIYGLRRQSIMLSFSLFSLAGGILCLSYCPLIIMITGQARLQISMLIYLTMIVPLLLYDFLRHVIITKGFPWIRAIIAVRLVWTVAVLSGGQFGLTYLDFRQVHQYLILVETIILTALVLRNTVRGKKDDTILAVGTLISTGIIVHDMMVTRNIIASPYYLMDLGILSFMLTLATVTARRFLETERYFQEQKRRILEIANVELETEVAKKSRDVERQITLLENASLELSRNRMRLAAEQRQNARILIGEPDTGVRQEIRMALAGTGVTVETFEKESEGERVIAEQSGHADILCIGDEFIHLADDFHRANPEGRVVWFSQKGLDQNLETMRNRSFITNLIGQDKGVKGAAGKEILTTVSKLINEDVFGLEKYLNWGAEIIDLTITGSENRDRYHDVIRKHLTRLGIGRRTQQKAILLAD